MKRILLLLTVCAALEMAGCCCHGHNDCINDGCGYGCDNCQQGCDGSCHKHCKLFHRKHSKDCQGDGCQGECQYQGQVANGYPVDGEYQVDNRCQANGNCKIKNRRTKKHKSCPHCGRQYAGGVQGSISPCCGETLIGDGCGTECGITQAGFCSGDCGECGGNVIGGDCQSGNCGGGCATGNCGMSGVPGATGGCATGNCGSGGPTPVAPTPRTTGMTHPYDELQALQAAGWSIVESPGSTAPSTMGVPMPMTSSSGMEPVPAPPSGGMPVPVRPTGSH